MQDKNRLLEKTVKPLTEWYRLNGRRFAWRDSPTPYHVWISEIMLQQTRIEAVIPYYDRFMKVLPDIKSLAEVPEETLMKLWQGLGYYSRARNLKKAASVIMNEYYGRLPETAEALKKLPGIGDYTAGAIASIAMNRPEPAVDGNVLRVVMRLLGQYDDVMLQQTKKQVYHALKEIYPEQSNEASLFTQGLMELGEVLCIPNGEPLCRECPLKTLCVAKRENIAGELPVRNIRLKRKQEKRTVFLLQCGEKYALKKRPDKGLLAGLWEFPNAPGILTEEKIRETFPQAGNISFAGEAKHIFTHIEWQMTCCHIGVPEELSGFVWADKREIEEKYAIPGAFRFVKTILQSQ